RRSGAVAVARLSEQQPHVPRPDPAAGGSLSPHRPDLPGFGQTQLLPREQFAYTFDNLANVIARFTDVLKLQRFGIYIFDYGSPVGLRLALKHPERVTAIVTQNGNAYL